MKSEKLKLRSSERIIEQFECYCEIRQSKTFFKTPAMIHGRGFSYYHVISEIGYNNKKMSLLAVVELYYFF